MEFILVSIILLLAVAVDATGDALRTRRKQIAHHVMEVVHIAIMFAVWALFGFTWEYIAMYLTGRIWAFNLTYNVVAGNKLTYLSEYSLYDRALNWFAEKVGEPGHLVWVIKTMALAFWLSWLFTR